MYYTDEQWKRIYDLIDRFIKLTGFSNRKFAKFVGIPPTTFQSMLNKKSRIKSDTLLSIVCAMQELEDVLQLENEEDQEELGDIVEDITEIHMNANLTEQEIESMRRDTLRKIALLDNPSVKDCINNMDKITESISTSFNSMQQEKKLPTLRDQLIDSFNRLNSKGQKIAVERMKELAEIPKYQRKYWAPHELSRSDIEE